MEPTTNEASCSATIDMEITSPEPFSDLNNDTNLTSEGMKSEFYNAAIDGNINAFEGLGEQIDSILTPNENTILHIHFTNYTDRVSEPFVKEVLFMCPTLVLKTNVKGETILHIAARYGHSKILEILIDCANFHSSKSLVRAINDKKDTALHEAARYGHTEVVDFLIKAEPDLSYCGKNVDDETPLYIAVERQYWNVVDTILDNTDSPQYDGPNGRTALHAAVLHDDSNPRQCNVNITALLASLPCGKGMAALTGEDFHGGQERVSKLLNKNWLAAKQADEYGWVPLHLAAVVGNKEAVELLVSEDRSTAYIRDKKGRTALHFAAFHKDSSVMEIILKYCPDCCELVDENGSNALHYTTMGPSYWVFELGNNLRDAPLIRNLYNEKDEHGNTPLHLLARQPPVEGVDCDHSLLKLQSPRVDTMACDRYGQTVLDVAVGDALPPYKNKLLKKIQDIGSRLGGRVLGKHLREKKKEKSHDSAVDQKKDYLDKRASTLSLVAILIATVTFTAAFTLPGGLNQDKGFPILKKNNLFVLFVVTDTLSFVLSTAAVSAFFFSSSIYFMIDVKKDLYEPLLNFSEIATGLALIFMVMAFGAGLGAVLGTSKGVGGAVTWGIVAFFGFICCIIILVAAIVFQGLLTHVFPTIIRRIMLVVSYR